MSQSEKAAYYQELKSGGVKFDYKLSDTATVFANFTYTPHGENGLVPVTTVSTAQTVATLNAQGQPTGTGAILPGYTDNRTEARPVAPARVCLSCFGWRLSSGVTVMSSRSPVGCTAWLSPKAA